MNTSTRNDIVVSPATAELIKDRYVQGIEPAQTIEMIRRRATRDLVTATESLKDAIQKVADDAATALDYLTKGHRPGHFGGRILHSSGIDVELASGKWNQAVNSAAAALTETEVQAAIAEGLTR